MSDQHLITLIIQNAKLIRERNRLRAALLRYGRHLSDCCMDTQTHTHASTECGCHCGLQAALEDGTW